MRSLFVLFFSLLSGLPVYAQTATLHSAQVMGGNGLDTVRRVVSDQSGFVYVLGSTGSSDFPATTTLGPESADMFFVAKIRVEGWTLIWSTVVRGADAKGLALGPEGSVYVVGFTKRPNELPGLAGAFRGPNVTDGSATFVMKLVDDGTRAAYTALITNARMSGTAQIAVDAAGRAVVGSEGFVPLTPGAYRKGTGAYYDPYVARLSSDGAQLEFGTALADSNSLGIGALAVDADGAVVVGGWVSDYPTALAATPGAYENRTPQSDDVFVLKLRSDGSDAVFLSVFGGSGGDSATQLAIAADGSIFVAGSCERGSDATAAVPFPVTDGAPFPDFQGFGGFVGKLSADGAALLFSTHMSHQAADTRWMVVQGGLVYAAYAGSLTGGFSDLGYGPTAALDVTRVLVLDENGGLVLPRVELPAFAPDAFTVVDGAFVVMANRSMIDRPVPVDLAAIGPLGRDPEKNKLLQTDITMGRFVPDDGERPLIDIDAGYLLFETLVSNDLQSKTVNLNGSEDGVPFQVFVPMPAVCCSEGTPYSVSPVDGVTPADVTIVMDPKVQSFSSPAASLLVVSAMGHPSVQLLPVARLEMATQLTVSTPAPMVLSPESGLLETEFQVRITGTSMLTGGTVEGVARLLLNPMVMSVPFTLTPTEGMTPLTVRVTAAEASVPPGSAQLIGLQVVGALASKPLYTTLTRPAAVAAPVSSTVLQIFGYQIDGTAATSLDVVAEGMQFQVASVPDGLTVEPMSGTGPARLQVLADLTRFPSGRTTYVSFEVKTGDTVTTIRVGVMPSAGGLTALIHYVDGPQTICPGLRMGVRMQGLVTGVPHESWSEVSPAPTDWQGYTFVYKSRVVPIVSANPGTGQFEVQIPYDLAPDVSGAPLEFRSSDGTVLGRSPIYGGEAETGLGLVLPMPGERVVWRSDGTVVTADNPAHPGETVLVEVVGAGRLDADVEAGRLPGEGEVWKPVAPLIATIGGKAAPLVSAEMSRRLIGVTEVVMEVPRLAAGTYRMGVFSGSSQLYGVRVWVGW